MADNKVEIKVTADAAQAVPVLNTVEKGIAATGSAAQQLQGKAAGAGQGLAQVGQSGEAAGVGLGKARQGVQSISEQLSVARTQLSAFISAQLGLSAVKDVAQTADAYNNLQARIKLATGEGEAFTTAFGAVADIAQRTNSNLEQTGELFAKLTDAGKSSGLATQDAIAQALGLTETINQAIQLSGGSAESAKASITQLIQGLQGGVLRGDEFNSVMEQSPRLAKALADGLGVTTGELRKMAEAGSLSSETVISALKGQSATLKKEFATLPPTVGRALENLSTSWTLYIGETDKATGASSTAASAINALSANLSTVAGYLLDAGQAAAALVALKLAQYFAGVGLAAQQSAVQVAASTAAVNAAGAAGTTAAVGVGRFASILSGLKTFTLLGIVTNFHDIGTAIGEGIAKLAGYKDGTEELARADKLAASIAAENLALRERGQALTQDAINKQFELSEAATASIAEFDKQTKAGSSAADAVAKIGKDFDLSTVPGIRDATAVLDKLAADGKISATQFQTAWADALKGADLAVFETQARAAFAGSAREAERLGQVLDASVREAIKRTGLDFEVISGGMGKASRSAINDTEAIISGLEGLKKQGIDTGQVLTASISKSINTADSQKALEAVKQQIEGVRKVLGDKVADGLLDQATEKALALSEALNKAKPGIQDVAEAMKLLGIASDESLKKTASSSKEAYDFMVSKGTSSARELADAFRKSAEAAIAANNGIAPSWVQAQAASRGYELQVDSAGKTTVRSASDGKRGVDGLADSYRDAGAAADDYAKRVANLATINDKYANPKGGSVTGSSREERLAGQAATDGTGAFSLREKQRAGTLSADDLKVAQAVMEAAEFNKQMFDENTKAYGLEGTRSIFEELNSATAILNQVKSLADQKDAAAAVKPSTDAPAPAPAPTSQPASTTHLIKYQAQTGQTTSFNAASANDASVAAELIKQLAQAKSAAGY